jgi:hypothetical protein
MEIGTIALAFVILSIVMFFGAYLGVWLHEGSHWLLGYLFDAEPEIIFNRGVVPSAVYFDSPNSMSNTGIRLAAGGPFIFLLVSTAVISRLWSPASIVELLIIGVGLGASIVSPADLLALIRPARWREFGDEYPEGSHRGAIRYLLGAE